LSGRIGLNVYSNADGKAMGSLTFHSNSLKILAFAKRAEQTENNGASQSAKQGEQPETADDLPF
jgi:single-strand DNA-binding protein